MVASLYLCRERGGVCSGVCRDGPRLNSDRFSFSETVLQQIGLEKSQDPNRLTWS